MLSPSIGIVSTYAHSEWMLRKVQPPHIPSTLLTTLACTGFSNPTSETSLQVLAPVHVGIPVKADPALWKFDRK